VQHEEGDDKSEGITGFIAFAALHGQEVIVAADNLKNPTSFRNQAH
jgi:hypothetical protein